MDVNTLTTVLGNFTNVLTQGQSRIVAAGDSILRGLALIEVVLACLWVAMDGTKTSDVFRKLLQLTFWLWFAKHFPSLVGFFKDSLISIASAAGGLGGNSSLLYDPSKIAGLGLDATQPLAQAIHDAGWSHFGQSLILVFALIPIVASFFIIACQATLAVIEYHLIVVLSCCLIPFGVSEHTKFISEKAISASVAVSIKLMVLSLILAILQPVLTTGLHFSGPEFTLNEALAMVLLSTLAAVLCWRVPGLAADLLSGSPSISTAAIAHNIQSGVTTGARMATHAVTYAIGAGRNAIAGTSFAARSTTRALTGGGSAIASMTGGAARGGPPPGSAPPLASPRTPTLPSTVASSSPPATSPPLATSPTSPSSRSA
jgi:type IV secretion system protein TrbL